MRPATFCFALLVLLFPIFSFAAQIEPGLEDRLLSAKPGEKFSVIVRLENPRDIAALDQELHAKRAPLAERHRMVIEALQANAAETQGPIITLLDAFKASGEVEGYKSWWIENLFVVYGTAPVMLELAKHPAIRSLGPNFSVELIEPVARGPIRSTRPGALDTEQTTNSQDAIRATEVNREMGINGAGTLVANCDTGVDGDHPALASRWRGTHAPHGECWLDLLGGGSDTPEDFGQHGTHVMGTICGREIDGNDTNTVGSAPLAEWIATNPINQGVSEEFDQDIFDAYEWFIDPDGDPETMEDVPDVIQNSWGVYILLGYPQCFADWNTVITNCEAAGPVITWSAGNESTNGLRSPAIYSLNATQIFSVGAVDCEGDLNPPYSLAGFSSQGPTPCTPAEPDNIKPEISAPGVDVYSSVPGGGYQGGWSGTSMAGPHVAGCVALMREACPDCDPQTIKEAIMETAVDDGYGPDGQDNQFGAGFLDCWEAVSAVFALGRIDGYATTSTGTPLQGVRVQSLTQGNFTLTNAAGYYNLSAQEGTHTVRWSKFGYETITTENIVTTEGDTVHIDVEMDQVPAGVLRGTVMTQAGIPIQNATVVIVGTPIDTMISDANGNITVALPATTFGIWLRMTVNTTPPRIYTNTVNVTVEEGPDTTFADLEIFVDLIEPAGPDAYGYKAYDRYDRDLPAPAEWFELDPDLGFPGTYFEYAHHDSSLYFPAPFPISFYGTSSDLLTVNPNGWMLPGEVHGPSAQETDIPFNLNDPPGIIAAFWDDMRIGLGARQFHYYDVENGRWIFEFLDQRITAPQNRFHNWQVHFLDPARYPSATGDVQIVVVYHLMMYLNSCTIGIENPAENTGVRIRFHNTVDSTAWPVEDGAAIRYTTGLATETGTLNGLLTLYPTSPNITNATVWVGGVNVHPAANGQYSSNAIPAAPISMLLDFEDYELARADWVPVGDDSTTTRNLTAWRLDPPQNLSAWQFNGLIHVSWNRPQSVQVMPNPNLLHDVFVNGQLALSDSPDTTYEEQRPNGMTFEYSVIAKYQFGQSDYSDTLSVTVDLGADENNSGLPTVYALYQNYPNPFNPTTSIRLDVPETAPATLMIYDITGRLVRTLYSGTLNAGRYSFAWDGNDGHGSSVATGVYLYRFSTPHFTASEKMVLIK